MLKGQEVQCLYIENHVGINFLWQYQASITGNRYEKSLSEDLKDIADDVF